MMDNVMAVVSRPYVSPGVSGKRQRLVGEECGDAKRSARPALTRGTMAD